MALFIGTAAALGVFARLFCNGYLLGASGAIYGVIAAFVLLMPSLRVEVFYFTLFPLSFLIGLTHRPKHWVYWFIRWDHFECRAIWGILLVPLLELWGLYWSGLNWTNLGHLFGVLCGAVGVLMLPDARTLRRRSAFGV